MEIGMKRTIMAALAAASVSLAGAAVAEGDPEAGEDVFRKCRACHTIADGDDVIVKGGRTGPNLYGVVGRQAGTAEDFRYGDDLVAAGEAGLVWSEENLVEYVQDPRTFLRAFLDDSGARSKMMFKLRRGGEDVAAYLASVAD